MVAARKALIIANDTYGDPGLARLASPAVDAVALHDVLADPEIGDFEVSVLLNETHHQVQAHIEDFMDASPDDLLLLYFSGHGIKAETGELFLAAANTRPTRLASTAVPASFVQQCMKLSRSRRLVLFLDCCYGGAFPQGAVVRAAGSADVLSSFPGEARLTGGRGRAVITASSAMEYAFEGGDLTGAAQPSVFAAALRDGLQTGEADQDGDGLVSLDELYEWLFERVRQVNPAQTPSRQFDLQGELHIAKSGRRRITPAPMPTALAAALNDPSMFARIGALTELRHRLASPDLGVAMAALVALRDVATHDIQQVAVMAQEILDSFTLTVETPSVAVRASGTKGAGQPVLRLSGVPLARAVVARTDSSAVTARVRGEEVILSAPAGPLGAAVAVTLVGPAGTVVVPVEVVAAAHDATTAPAAGPVDAATDAAAAAAGSSSRSTTDADFEPTVEPGPASPGTPSGGRALRRTLDRPVVSPVLASAWLLWVSINELTDTTSDNGTALLVLGLVVSGAALGEWWLGWNRSSWAVAILINASSAIPGFLWPPPSVAYCVHTLTWFAFDVALLAWRFRQYLLGSRRRFELGAILALTFGGLSFLVEGIAGILWVQAAEASVIQTLFKLDGVAVLVVAALCLWSPLSLIRRSTDEGASDD